MEKAEVLAGEMEAINMDRYGMVGLGPLEKAGDAGVAWRLESEERGSRLEDPPGAQDS